MDEATESGSGFIGTDDSVFKGTMVKAEQLAHSMVADDTRGIPILECVFISRFLPS
jgi:hypothetical protein